MKTFKCAQSAQTCRRRNSVQAKMICSSCIILLTAFFISVTARAQSPDDANLIIQNGQGFFTVQIPDTISITHLEVNLGTHEGATDLFNHIFNYDQTAGLSSVMSYQRAGNSVTLGLGNINSTDTRFARVRLKHSGQWSDWFSFLAN